jgi:hypothetical protein
VLQAFHSDRLFLASIALKGGGFIEEIQKRKDVRLIEIDEGRRNAVAEEIVREIRELSAQGMD